LSASVSTLFPDWAAGSNLDAVLSPGSFLIISDAASPTTDWGIYQIDSLETGVGATNYGAFVTHVASVGSWVLSKTYSIDVAKGPSFPSYILSSNSVSASLTSTSLSLYPGFFLGSAEPENVNYKCVLNVQMQHSIASGWIEFDMASFSFSTFGYTSIINTTRRHTFSPTAGTPEIVHYEVIGLYTPTNSAPLVRYRVSGGTVTGGNGWIGTQRIG
jgi:hypothetical protein